MNVNDFKLWTAIVTPFNKDLTVDYDSLKNLVKEQVDAKNGLLVLGSTGEALNISNRDKKEIVKFVVGLKPNAPIMVGVSGHDLEETKTWLSFLEEQTIHAYLMVTPIYAKPGNKGQYLWFKTLMDCVSRPCMLYNVPSRAGTALSLEAIERLREHKNYWSIKEASGSVEKFKDYLKASGNRPVYCGDDGLMPDFALNGSSGLVSVASNVWPVATHKYVEQCLNKTFDAKELWENAANSMFIASNPVPAKAILAHQKRIKNNTMMPPLSAEDLADLTAIEVADERVNTWLKGQN
jgi:4-hydroxy-tetrahydrodipicolinate synthase